MHTLTVFEIFQINKQININMEKAITKSNKSVAVNR